MHESGAAKVGNSGLQEWQFTSFRTASGIRYSIGTRPLPNIEYLVTTGAKEHGNGNRTKQRHGVLAGGAPVAVRHSHDVRRALSRPELSGFAVVSPVDEDAYQ